jgi:hypothetical protein
VRAVPCPRQQPAAHETGRTGSQQDVPMIGSETTERPRCSTRGRAESGDVSARIGEPPLSAVASVAVAPGRRSPLTPPRLVHRTASAARPRASSCRAAFVPPRLKTLGTSYLRNVQRVQPTRGVPWKPGRARARETPASGGAVGAASAEDRRRRVVCGHDVTVILGRLRITGRGRTPASGPRWGTTRSPREPASACPRRRR